MADPKDALNCGIDIVAQPPGKKLQTLSAALRRRTGADRHRHSVRNARPEAHALLLLDEIEAALDDANIDNFAEYLKTFPKTQFVVVTHRKGTMERCDALYGVAMEEKGVSRLVSVRLSEAVKEA